MKPTLPVAIAALLTSLSSQACDFEITKTELPLENKVRHENLCLENYFEKRDLGRFSLGEDHRTGAPVIFRDTANSSFGEMYLFKTNSDDLLGIQGRLALAKKVYANYMNSLRNDFGACKLEIRSGDRLLSIEDFIPSERNEAEQPGSRLMLTKDDVKSPHWKLLCADANGKEKIEKEGDYFFIFVDIYDNISPGTLQNNLGKYLFSFR